MSRITQCPVCLGEDKHCPECEGCGEVVWYTKEEVAKLDEHLKKAGFAGADTPRVLSKAQAGRFVAAAIGHAKLAAPVRSDQEKPDDR